MRLYRVPYSTNVQRVDIALAYKGLEATAVEVPVDNRSELERVSGQPLAPVLVDGDNVVLDSSEILRYLETKQQDPVAGATPSGASPVRFDQRAFRRTSAVRR